MTNSSDDWEFKVVEKSETKIEDKDIRKKRRSRMRRKIRGESESERQLAVNMNDWHQAERRKKSAKSDLGEQTVQKRITHQPAHMIKRSLAFLIDVFILVAIGLGSYVGLTLLDSVYPFTPYVSSLPWKKIHLTALEGVSLTVFAVFYVGLFLLPVWGSGQTLGKKIFRIKVTSYFVDRTPFIRVLLREMIVKTLSLASLLGCLLPFFNPLRRSLHDYVCSTVVVNIND